MDKGFDIVISNPLVSAYNLYRSCPKLAKGEYYTTQELFEYISQHPQGDVIIDP